MTSPHLLALAGFHLPPPPLWPQMVPGACVFVGAQVTQNTAYYNGNTYVGLIDGSGNVRVASINNTTAAVTIGPTIRNLVPDQHSAPGVLVRSSDGRIVVAFADVAVTSGVHIYAAISTNPEDVTAWPAATDISGTLGIAPYTYCNHQQLSGEAGKIYLFVSSGFPPGTQSWWFATSTDGGVTLSAPTELWVAAGKTSYVAVASDDTQRIDFACSDGSAVNGQTGSLYHFYYDGAFRQTDGTPMGAPPFGPANATKVYDGPTNGNMRVAYMVTKTGPTIVFATCDLTSPLTAPITYRYALWTGSAWAVNAIVDDGAVPNPNTWEYGITLDPNDNATVILGRAGDLFRYATPDGGVTWAATQQTTDGQYGPYLRPMAVRNAAPHVRAICSFGPWPPENTQSIGAQILRYTG